MEFHGDQKRPKGHVDPFSSLMFGINRGDDKEEESTEESLPSETERSDEPQWDPWLFGKREDHKHTPSNQIENLLDQVDLFLLMETVDEAIKTYKMYQPIFQEITPLFKKFLKKG
jgi:hypothetical protein